MNKTNEKEIILNSVADVHKYLKNSNWKISKTQLYEHAEQKKLKKTDEGIFSAHAVNKYALKYLRRVDGSKPSKEHADIQERKYEADARQSIADAEFKEIKTKILKGEYVPRDAFERELVKRAVVFKSDIENFIRINGEKIVAMVSGDPAKIPALIDYYLDAVADWMNRYDSDKEFVVTGQNRQLNNDKILMDDNEN